MKNNKKTIVIVIVYILIVIASVTLLPVLTDIIKKETESTRNETCCLNAGGKWENNTCTDGGNIFYEQKTYQSCVEYKKT